MSRLSGLLAVYRRELSGYFATPVAYVFVAVFLLALGAFTFQIGRYLDTGRVDLAPFFVFHPWLYVVFMPALAMRLWADELRAGTFDLLMALPVRLSDLVLGKFLAAWTVAAFALALTLPMWLTANLLGKPDNSAILLSYAISLLMAGGYIAIGAAFSSLSNNQVVAFVLATAIAFVFTAAGLPLVASAVRDAFGAGAGALIAQFSTLGQFEAAQRGVLELRAIAYFGLLIGAFLTLNGVWVAGRRG